MAESDNRLASLEDEMKVLKGEVSRTLIDLRSLLMSETSPLKEGGLIRRLAPASGGAGQDDQAIGQADPLPQAASPAPEQPRSSMIQTVSGNLGDPNPQAAPMIAQPQTQAPVLPNPVQPATATPVPATATPTPVPSDIATDDWESGGFSGGSGWLSDWSVQGGNDTVVTSQNSPYAGTNHLRMRDSGSYATRDLNLSGQTGVHLKFYAKVDGFEGSDYASVLVSPDNVTWTTVKLLTASDSDSVYKLVDIDISSYSMTSQFHIAFEGNMSNNSDRLLIDNIEID